jgi:P-loop containing NTP hydrolase pore-1
MAMMELIAMHLKGQGSYLARCLSYEDCRFDTIEDAVSTEQIAQYDAVAGNVWEVERWNRERITRIRREEKKVNYGQE